MDEKLASRLSRRTLLQGGAATAGIGFLAPVVDAYRKDVHNIDFNFQTFNKKTAWVE